MNATGASTYNCGNRDSWNSAGCAPRATTRPCSHAHGQLRSPDQDSRSTHTPHDRNDHSYRGQVALLSRCPFDEVGRPRTTVGGTEAASRTAVRLRAPGWHGRPACSALVGGTGRGGWLSVLLGQTGRLFSGRLGPVQHRRAQQGVRLPLCNSGYTPRRCAPPNGWRSGEPLAVRQLRWLTCWYPTRWAAHPSAGNAALIGICLRMLPQVREGAHRRKLSADALSRCIG